MTGTIELCVPDLGSYHDIPVIEVLVSIGDPISVDTPVVTLESDKSTMDVPATATGIVTEVCLKVGDRVSQGSLILCMTTNQCDDTLPPTLAVSDVNLVQGVAPSTSLAPVEIHSPPKIAPGNSQLTGPCGPSVRKLARELGIDLSMVNGTGPKGRLLKEDVSTYVKKIILRNPKQTATTPANIAGINLLPWPIVDFKKFGPILRRARSRIQNLSAANLARNWVMIPHVTNFDEADITDLEGFRQQINMEQSKDGTKVTLLAFLIKAATHTLKTFPAFNSSLDGDEIVEKRYWHIGFAADTPNGLVVPVIRDADIKSVLEIGRECAELARFARENKLKSEQMQGGCFTISSLGGIGGTGFTPIINAPEVAILGVTKANWKPVWDGSQFRPHLMLPLCLSWDHRAVDGASAARFLQHFSRLVADFRRVML